MSARFSRSPLKESYRKSAGERSFPSHPSIVAQGSRLRERLPARTGPGRRLEPAAATSAALVQFQQGNMAAARQMLQQAREAFDFIWPDPLAEAPPFLHDDTMRALILYREARETLESAEGPGY